MISVWKRSLAVFLILLMCFATLPFAAFAEETIPVEFADVAEDNAEDQQDSMMNEELPGEAEPEPETDPIPFPEEEETPIAEPAPEQPPVETPPVDHKVVFRSAETGKAVAVQVVRGGSRAWYVPVEAEGFVFCGWFTARENGEPYDFSLTLDKDMTLYAIWAPIPENDWELAELTKEAAKQAETGIPEDGDLEDMVRPAEYEPVEVFPKKDDNDPEEDVVIPAIVVILEKDKNQENEVEESEPVNTETSAPEMETNTETETEAPDSESAISSEVPGVSVEPEQGAESEQAPAETVPEQSGEFAVEENVSNEQQYLGEPATEYTVVFNANGGTGNMPNQAIPVDQSITLATNTFTRPGYSFLGWSKDASSGTVHYFNGQNMFNEAEAGAVLTLYAVWTPIHYTVQFDANGGTDGYMAPQSFTGGSAQALAANAYSWAGHKFLGWARQKDATVKQYGDGDTVQDLSVTEGEVITLYAVWTNSYDIVFNPSSSGVSGTMANQTILVGNTVKLTSNAYSRTGYTFKGWSLTAGSTTVNYNDGDIAPAGEAGQVINLYAVWKANTCTVIYNGNGATYGSMSNQTFNFAPVSQNLTANAFQRTGYVFAGWTTDPHNSTVIYRDNNAVVVWNAEKKTVSGTGVIWQNLLSTDGATVTLYAVWKPITGTVKALVSNSARAYISGPVTASVPYGGSATFTCVIKSAGYYIGRVTLDGIAIGDWYGDNGTYTYTYTNDDLNDGAAHSVVFVVYNNRGNPATGDGNNILLWCGLAAVAAAAGVGVVIYLKKRR